MTALATSPLSTIDKLIRGGCIAVLWASTVVIFVILVGNTILRYATGSSMQWGSEVPELLFPWLVMAGIVLAAQQGAHITTSFLMEALPAAGRRLVALLGWLGVAALYLTLSWATWRMLDIVHDEKSPILRIPGSVSYACVMLGMLLLALLAAQSAWRVWRGLPSHSGTGELEPTAAGGPAAPPAVHW